MAALAGVSPATVSRSLSGQGNVSAQTRERVRDAARRLSYVPSPLASGLASGRTRTIGVVVPFLTRWYFGSVVSGVTRVMEAAGYDVLLYHLGSAADRDRFFARMPLARRVDGVLSLCMPLTEDHTLALRALDIPLVSVGSRMAGLPSVCIDDVAAAHAAVNHLINLGHENIAFVGGIPDDPGFGFVSSELRLRGYRSAMGAAGLAPPSALEVFGRYGIDGGATAMARLLSGARLPTAVFAEYDELAFGALWSLRRAGLAIPQDVSVVGLDDHEMAEVLDLTTVGQDAASQGSLAATMLLETLDGRSDTPPTDIVLPTELRVRGTTAPPRRGVGVVPST
ncbi:LacI family DNA-binding transcriptional regulator [Nostocoides japonicum]|uniref:LacI family DNA-binding transcriptional regulator n=1 Tax=Nostocoides japonicum TaxID=99481 RepID=UPI00069E5D95|nr:LacI family DNA-binding transcriptional regulator [Tetrasphaera japonica]